MAETILKKNLAYIENEIAKMRRVPQRLFEDADEWSVAAKQKLDKFEENIDKPNFINYDMLESKEPGQGPDIVNFGETLINELEEHKDISAARVKNQIAQLGLTFNHQVIGQLSKVATCQRVDGVQIDESELSSLEEMIKEASWKEDARGRDSIQSNNPMNQTENKVITRQSLSVLAGDENDLLSESPVFQKAKGADQPGSGPFEMNIQKQNAPRDAQDNEFEEIDE